MLIGDDDGMAWMPIGNADDKGEQGLLPIKQLPKIGNLCHKLRGVDLKSGAIMMATMNISVPEPMKDWVQAQVETGVYANSSDYIRDLIRKDQENRTNIAALQKAITEGLESGMSPKSFDEIVNEARQQLKQHP